MDKDDQKEGFSKRLKNIEEKYKEQLQAIKDQGKKQLKELKNIGKNKILKVIDKISKKGEEVYKLLSELKKIDKRVDNVKLACTKTDGTKYDFNRFAFPLKLFEKIYSRKITLYEAREKQAELKELINKLNDYGPRIKKKKKNRREK